MLRLFQRLTFGEKIAGLALVLSILAFGNSVWQGFDQKRHQRLSVEPVLSAVFVIQNDPDFFGILIENTGFGPARLTNVQLFVDGAFVGRALDPTWRKVLRLLEMRDEQVIATTSFFQTANVQAGKAIRIFGAFHKDLTPDLKKKIYAARQRLQFSICYCSLYNDCFSFNSPGLSNSPCPSQ